MKQSGFTLVELVMVIIILGTLSAVAIPKYIDLKATSQQAATDSVAAAVSSASAINYSSRKAGATGTIAITTCGAAGALLANNVAGALPAGYTFTAGATNITAEATVACSITGPNSTTSTAYVTGIT